MNNLNPLFKYELSRSFYHLIIDFHDQTQSFFGQANFKQPRRVKKKLIWLVTRIPKNRLVCSSSNKLCCNTVRPWDFSYHQSLKPLAYSERCSQSFPAEKVYQFVKSRKLDPYVYITHSPYKFRVH